LRTIAAGGLQDNSRVIGYCNADSFAETFHEAMNS